MHDRIQARLEELRAEYAKGEQTLADLERQVASVRATMLRISGAIQVLAELTQPTTAERNGGGAYESARVDEPSLVAAASRSA